MRFKDKIEEFATLHEVESKMSRMAFQCLLSILSRESKCGDEITEHESEVVNDNVVLAFRYAKEFAIERMKRRRGVADKF